MIKTKIKRIEELDDKYLILNEKEMGFCGNVSKAENRMSGGQQ